MKKSIYLLIVIALLSCTGFMNGNDDIKTIRFLSKIQVYSVEDMKLQTIIDSCEITYGDSLIMVSVPIRDFQINKLNVKNDSILVRPEDVTRLENKMVRYIFRKGQKYGRWYDSIQVVSGKIFSVDSLLSSRNMSGISVIDDKDSLISTIGNSNELTEVYVRNNNTSFDYPDTTSLHFNKKLRSIEFSIDRSLDKLKSSKLYRVHSVFKPVEMVVNEEKIKVPKRVFEFYFKEVPSSKSSAMFFKKFKKE